MFSCRGIQLAVEWFMEKGHKDITVFVPAWRKEQSRPDALITGRKVIFRKLPFKAKHHLVKCHLYLLLKRVIVNLNAILNP